MKLHPALIELVVSDMAATLTFYRRLGLDIPRSADEEPHVDIELPGGLRLAWDTEETIRSFDPGWSPPTGGGHRAALAFACESPAEVDAAWEDLTAPATRAISNRGTPFGACATPSSSTQTADRSTCLLCCPPCRADEAGPGGSSLPERGPPG